MVNIYFNNVFIIASAVLYMYVYEEELSFISHKLIIFFNLVFTARSFVIDS